MVILGHRGASGYAPENTIAAFKKGLELKCDGFEFDVQLTKDGELVVYHDFELGRTSNGEGRVVDKNLDYIKSLDAGKWFSNEFTGEKIPTLGEVLECIPKGLLINIEAKVIAADDRNIGERIVEEVIKYDRVEDVIVSSFNHKVLKEISNYSKDVRVGALVYARMTNLVEYITELFPVYSVHLAEHQTDQEIINQLKESGIKTYIWTVNTADSANRFKNAGVDGIITNYPDLYSK